MKKLCRDLIVGPKDSAESLVLMSWLGFLTFLALAGWAIIGKGQAFDPQAYGIGFGAMLGSCAAGLGLKAKFEGRKEDA